MVSSYITLRVLCSTINSVQIVLSWCKGNKQVTAVKSHMMNKLSHCRGMLEGEDGDKKNR